MKKTVVTYIRIRELIHPFLIYTYGDLPIDLPATDELHDIFVTGLVPNYSMKQLCYSTFSQAAYEKGMGNNQITLFGEENSKAFLPKPEDKDKLVPFVMPSSVIIGGKRKNTDQWFQLCNSSYKQFRAIIESRFWNEFDKFNLKVRLYCTRENLKYSQEMAIEKFMIKVGMDMDDFDTMARKWREYKSSQEQQMTQYSNKEPTANLREQLDYDLIVKADDLDSVYNR